MPHTAVKPPPPITVVLGIILRQGRVLVGWRDRGLYQGDCWEFPGGKVKATETPRQALARELEEEIGITIKATYIEPLIKFEWYYDIQKYFFSVYLVKDYSGKPQSHFYGRLKWQAIKSLNATDFPPANHIIIKALLLPQCYLITPMGLDIAVIEQGLNMAFQSGISLAVFRAPDFNSQTYIDNARRLLSQNPNFSTSLLIHNHPNQVEIINAAGVQLSAEHAKKYRTRPVSREVLLAISCHSRAELEYASKLEADFALLGPIKTTPCHHYNFVLGWNMFKALVKTVAMPVYAIGGLSIRDLATSRTCGAQGIAAIRGFWPL